LVPCDQLLNISFNFGGVNYPIHPLDTVSDDFNMTDSSGNSICVGTFQPITTAFSLLGSYDLILGMAFLRNTYTLLDYGDFVDASSNDRGSPFVQLLPLTNVNTAHNDFVQARLNGQDTTGSPSKALLPASQCQHSPESEEEKKQHYEEMVLSRWPYILAGCLLFLILTIALIVWRCCCRRNRRAKKTTAGLLPEENTTYAPLHDQNSSLNLKPLGDSYSGNFNSHRDYDNGSYYKGGWSVIDGMGWAVRDWVYHLLYLSAWISQTVAGLYGNGLLLSYVHKASLLPTTFSLETSILHLAPYDNTHSSSSIQNLYPLVSNQYVNDSVGKITIQ